ncbi:MAG: VWA domain-containing protein [Acidobacteria bacterium]|nr:VWA domain-containing protein [Acidobacteriota bacterium]
MMLRILALLLLLAITVTGQTKPPASAQSRESDEVLKLDTREVLLPVTVRDRAGQFVPNLKAEDFSIYEDNVLQPISSFSLKHLPVHVVLLIDTSSSVTRELDDFKDAANNFAARLDPNDQISVIKFDDKVELVMDWTANRNALRRALNRLTTGMFTNFNDALWLTARDQLNRVNGRKAIIVLTDGIDSGRGRKTQAQVLRAMQEAEAPIYAVSKTEIQRSAEKRDLELSEKTSSPVANQMRVDGLKLSLAALDQGETWLTKLSEETGGRLFLPKSFDELSDAYQQVADELRSQYVIFYTPRDASGDGRYRTVRVKAKCSDCRTTSRLGYFAK